MTDLPERSVDLTAFSETTMTRVRGILKSYIGEDQQVTGVINSLQNIGILFRERVYDEERKPLTTQRTKLPDEGLLEEIGHHIRVNRELAHKNMKLREENADLRELKEEIARDLRGAQELLRSIRAQLDAVL